MNRLAQGDAVVTDIGSISDNILNEWDPFPYSPLFLQSLVESRRESYMAFFRKSSVGDFAGGNLSSLNSAPKKFFNAFRSAMNQLSIT